MTVPSDLAAEVDPADSAHHDLMRSAAARAESALSIARALFCAVVLVRFLSVKDPNDPAWWAALPEVPCLLFAIGASIWIWLRARRGHVSTALLALSIAIDASVCALSLLQTVLWSAGGPGYEGVLRQPDIGAQLVTVMAAGLRLSTVLSAFSGVLHGLFATVLIVTDHAISGDRLTYGAADISMFGILLCAATVAAAITAARTRALVVAAATESARVERARSRLALLAQAQHDAKSLLSAAMLRVDAGLAQLAPSNRPKSSEDVYKDLEYLRTQLEALGEYTHGELLLLKNRSEVDIREVLQATLPILAHRFNRTQVNLVVAETASTAPVLLVGGPEALQRMLYALVANASEGDGVHAAGRIEISFRSVSAGALLQVEDDGPGFAHSADSTLQPSATTKPKGQGLGLHLIAQLVEASGGALELGTSEALHGARVRVSLPTTRAAPTRAPAHAESSRMRAGASCS